MTITNHDGGSTARSALDGLTADRQVFRCAAGEWARIITVAWHRESADPAIERLHALSGRWAACDRLRDLLTPLLEESEPLHVRVCAATHLYRHGIADVVPLLREFARNTDDVVTSPARAVLSSRKAGMGTVPRTRHIRRP